MTTSGSKRLNGKTALVTGSTRGLGRSIAERLADEGARVVVNGRSPDDVRSVVSELRSAGHDALGFDADLALPSGAHHLAKAVLDGVERLDILVNNAGMSFQEPFWEISDEDFEYQTNVNYRSPFILSQHVARHMMEHSIRGRIVNFSTIGAHSCHADRLVYDAAKGAVEVMTRNMAFELGPYGISVNTVIPGAIAVRPGADGDTAEWNRYAENNIPLGRVGQASDIATTVLFFCLPETEFISGQGLLVDGAHNTWLPESTE
jgi:NAD(P)-dependent dehydrogenase (short-subunit alcohol dehydrogenase family)